MRSRILAIMALSYDSFGRGGDWYSQGEARGGQIRRLLGLQIFRLDKPLNPPNTIFLRATRILLLTARREMT